MSVPHLLEGFSWEESFQLFVRLLVIINVFGIIPFIIRAKKETGKVNPWRTTITGFILSLTFLFIGKYILAVNGVSIVTFKAAGGIILLTIGIEMVFDLTINKMTIEGGKDPSVTPLAFPLTIGAGTLTSLVSFREEYMFTNVFLALLGNIFVIYLVFSYVEKIQKILGPLVLSVLQRLMGVLLMSFGIQALKNGFFS